MKECLLIAAFSPEIAPFEPWVNARSDLALGLCGIGMVEAAARTVELINSFRPKHVLFVGSVGATSKDTPLLSLQTASEVFLVDENVLDGRAFIPERSTQRYESDPLLRRKIESLSQRVSVSLAYSTLGITRDEGLATRYTNSFSHCVENMELFGLASACALKGIFWNSLSCVTNHIGAASHTQWTQRIEAAAEQTSNAARELFEGLSSVMAD